MRGVAFAVPGSLVTPTGGYAYDRRMIAELKFLGWSIDVVDLGEGFPTPSAQTRARAQALLAALPVGCPVIIDGLAFGVLPDIAVTLRLTHPLIALVHHPLAMETGISEAAAAALRASEKKALGMASRVVVTSAPTARILTAEYGIAAHNIVVARPGTDPAPQARGSQDGIVRLLAVGSIVPRKGFDLLVAALARLQNLPWELTIAGDRTRDPATAAQLEADIARLKLGGRIGLLGAITRERLGALYSEADVFALPSHYEGYGMAFAEALAHGLPIVATRGGAIPETVPSEAGILVAPGDLDALTRALRDLIENRGQRERLAAAARNAAKQLPSWRDSAKLMSDTIEAVT